MSTTTVNVAAVETAKNEFKASLQKQIEPINLKIADLKSQIATLENEKRGIETLLKSLDKKPTQGRVWSAEAKAKLSASLKAAAARKKAAQGQTSGAATATPVPQGTQAPVVDSKMKAANDDSATTTPASKKKAAK